MALVDKGTAILSAQEVRILRQVLSQLTSDEYEDCGLRPEEASMMQELYADLDDALSSPDGAPGLYALAEEPASDEPDQLDLLEDAA